MPEYLDCECGKKYTFKNRKQHARSQFHKENTQQQTLNPDKVESERLQNEITEAINSEEPKHQIEALMNMYVEHARRTGCGDEEELAFIESMLSKVVKPVRHEVDINIERMVGNEKHLIATGTLVRINGDAKGLYKVVREKLGMHSIKNFKTGKPIRGKQFLASELTRC